ncbi:MAG TPA: mechanosensitive ion channel domain-containing protein [Planctomycetota bacterium]|nr:mechanosensitive ion channel domain-containing protein [Planctomycetota bacterium]
MDRRKTLIGFVSGLPDAVVWGVLLAAAAAAVGALFLVRRNRRPSFARDFLLILGLSLPIPAAALAIVHFLPPDSPWRMRAQHVLTFAVAALGTYAAARLAVTAVRWGAEYSDVVRASRTTFERFAQFVVLVVGALVLLDALRVPITPLLTTLGVGTLAVALALQDTLANFFSGLYLAADRPIREGDYVRLDSGEEGYILSVGWRSTRMRTIAGNVAVVPNAKLARASITNFDMPARAVQTTIRVPVAYGQDTRRVARVLAETVAGAVGQVPGLLATPAPAVLFAPGFGDLALEFSVQCHVAGVEARAKVEEELRHRIAERFRAEEISFLRAARL